MHHSSNTIPLLKLHSRTCQLIAEVKYFRLWLCLLKVYWRSTFQNVFVSECLFITAAWTWNPQKSNIRVDTLNMLIKINWKPSVELWKIFWWIRAVQSETVYQSKIADFLWSNLIICWKAFQNVFVECMCITWENKNPRSVELLEIFCWILEYKQRKNLFR